MSFNISGLDTVKYNERDYKELVSDVIGRYASNIGETSLNVLSRPDIDDFMISRGFVMSQLTILGEKVLDDMGKPFGFRYGYNFSGVWSIYIGDFTRHGIERIIWVLKSFSTFLNERRKSLQLRVDYGQMQLKEASLFEDSMKTLQIWVIVSTDELKRELSGNVAGKLGYNIVVQSMADVEAGK